MCIIKLLFLKICTMQDPYFWNCGYLVVLVKDLPPDLLSFEQPKDPSSNLHNNIFFTVRTFHKSTTYVKSTVTKSKSSIYTPISVIEAMLLKFISTPASYSSMWVTALTKS